MTCNRCITVNPLTNNAGDACTTCGCPIVRNFGSFDSLPLVEFAPDASIPPARVKELLKSDAPMAGGGGARGGGWNQRVSEQEQVLSMAQDEGLENDLFAQCLLENTDHQGNGANYKPVSVSEDVMRSMRFEEVFIQDMSHHGTAMPKRYYKNMVPDVAINMCENCCRFFIQDEYEFAYMEHGHCPFCKHVEKDKGQAKVFGSLADMRM